MGARTRISGAWEDVASIYARVGGTWKEIDTGYAKIAGVWKEFYSAGIHMVATGGDMLFSGGYMYHTFTSSGTFQVLARPVDIDFLVVAGGGGGG